MVLVKSRDKWYRAGKQRARTLPSFVSYAGMPFLPFRVFPAKLSLSSLRLGLFLIVSLGTLSGCVYFNTYYNAEKAYRQAMALRENRLEKNPNDSVLASTEEKMKFERCVTKCSKVLELYPEEKAWQNKAVFLMAEAYFQEGEWTRCIGKYDEFLQYFPLDTKVPKAEVHRAIALYQTGQYLASRSGLERMLATPLEDDLRTEALLCLAKLEGVGGSDEATLAAYERLLKDAAKTPLDRARAHAAAADLAYRLKQWDRARQHARAPEIAVLPVSQRLRLAVLSADALYQLKQYSEGIAELQPFTSIKVFRDSLAPIHLKMAEGHLALKQDKEGFALIGKVTRAAPHTALSAEAWYRRGEHELRIFHAEAEAKVSYDSSAAQGPDFDYAKLARARGEALARLAEYRKAGKAAPVDSAAPWRDEFMISELFLFQLDQIDSALIRLDSIADSPKRDSLFTKRANYARAYIQEEYRQDKVKADSLYRLVMERYPGTPFAQQAERNLGLKPTVQTTEDSAHALFLMAEKARFGGGDLIAEVIPAYSQVVAQHPNSDAAAKAQFVIAMLYEGWPDGLATSRNLDSAKSAYVYLKENFPQSEFAPLAQSKLMAAGVRSAPPSSKTATPSPSGSGKGTDSASAPIGSVAPVDTSGPKTAIPGPIDHRPIQAPPDAPPVPSVPVDSSGPPEGKTKEVLEPNYDDVDQY